MGEFSGMKGDIIDDVRGSIDVFIFEEFTISVFPNIPKNDWYQNSFRH